MVEILVTISSLSALITIYFNDWIISKFGIKNTVVFGLVSGMVLGILTPFCTNYYLFFCTRFLFGMSVGLYSPHAISLIALTYKDEERSTLLGIQMGVGALGNSCLLLLTGFFASYGWRYAFSVYLSLGIIALLVYYLVPDIYLEDKLEKITHKKIQLPMKTIFYLFVSFITFLILWGVQFKLPLLLVERNFRNMQISGTLLSLMNVAGILAGFSFGFFYRRIKESILLIGYLGAFASVIGLLNSQSLSMIFFYSILFNFLYSFTGPMLVTKINQNLPMTLIPKANSLFTMMTILSVFLSSIIWNSLFFITKQQVNAAYTLEMISIVLLMMSIALSMYYIFRMFKKKEKW